jgi:protease-4
MEKKAPLPLRWLRALWHLLTTVRNVVLNLLFLLLLLGTLLLWLSSPRDEYPEGAALIFNPDGDIVEQRSEPFLTDTISGRSVSQETLLRDVIDVIDHAAADPKIDAMVLDPKQLGAVGISKLRDIGAALLRFRDAGKPIIAYADAYNQSQYLLAVHANRVYVNPMGHVWLDGFGIYRQYLKNALEKLSIQFHVFRVGKFKSAMEPFLRNDMSADAKEANLTYLNVIWQAYKDDVASLREFDAVDIDTYVNGFADLLAQHDGDAAVLALNYDLVDGLKTRDAFRNDMIERVGRDKDDKTFKQVGFNRYMQMIRPELEEKAAGRSRVGIIVARGIIMDGKQPPGRIGSDSLSALIRQARQDEAIKSLVLRIDSGGGSAIASEIIRQEIELTRAAGKPVVVSMGSVAASGGYWIAVGADEIWASPTTVTGSIGIFAAFPTFDQSLQSLGINSDGVGTTRLAGAFDPARPLNPLMAGAIEHTIRRGYRRFISRVSEGRNMPSETVEKIAQGRIWSGENALAIGLVDHLGGLGEAIEAAARRVDLDKYGIEYIETPLSTRQLILHRLLRFFSVSNAPPAVLPGTLPALYEHVVENDLALLLRSNEWHSPLAYCFSCGLLQ